MKKILLCSMLALTSVCMVACHENRKAKNYNNKTMVDDAGLNFITNGSEAGLTEITAAHIALKNSTNPAITKFANMMIADHTNIGNELKKLAADKYVSINNTVSEEHRNMLNLLSAKSGSDFDKAYMQMMVNDHQKVVQLFEDGTMNTNIALNKFAKVNLPKVQSHLKDAHNILKSL